MSTTGGIILFQKRPSIRLPQTRAMDAKLTSASRSLGKTCPADHLLWLALALATDADADAALRC